MTGTASNKLVWIDIIDRDSVYNLVLYHCSFEAHLKRSSSAPYCCDLIKRLPVGSLSARSLLDKLALSTCRPSAEPQPYLRLPKPRAIAH